MGVEDETLQGGSKPTLHPVHAGTHPACFSRFGDMSLRHSVGGSRRRRLGCPF